MSTSKRFGRFSHPITRGGRYGGAERRANQKLASKKRAASGRRRWSTMKGVYPGTYKEGNKWVARISIDSKWFYLGIFPTEWEAGQAAKKARERKAAGLPVNRVAA